MALKEIARIHGREKDDFTLALIVTPGETGQETLNYFVNKDGTRELWRETNAGTIRSYSESYLAQISELEEIGQAI